jgi:glucosyl-3-phosphoglycerate synthase
MADFFQNGPIATLPALGEPDVARLERELTAFAAARPIALVLPCHASELGTPALAGIVARLREIPYLSEIVVGLDGADAAAWKKARRTFAGLPARLVWHDGPRMKKLRAALAAGGLAVGPAGKGRNLWLCFGFVLATGRARVVAVHDCDIATYDRAFLARLCYPVANPALGYDFAKGYSARFSDRLHGRVTRLLFTPLVRSLAIVLGPHPFLAYLDAFRYALSGEMCLDADLLRRTRMPADWGVEVGLLAEMFRHVSPRAVCQVDIAARYDHRHHPVVATASRARRPVHGLEKTAADVAGCLFRTLALQGIPLDRARLDALLAVHLRTAEDAIRTFDAVAALNGLHTNRHEEEILAGHFLRSLRSAADSYLADPLGAPLIPNWNRVEAACPALLGEFRDAVARDNA